MIEYALDTNACIALINGSSATVRTRLRTARLWLTDRLGPAE